MKLQVFKCDGTAYVVGGYGLLDGTVGELVEITLIDPMGDDSILVSGIKYVFKDGKAYVKADDFKDGKASDIRIYSGGRLYIIEGLTRYGRELKLSEETVHRYIGQIIVDAYKLRLEVLAANERIKKLEDVCSGDDFL